MPVAESNSINMRLRLFALLAGAICHLLFVGAVALMAFSLYSGLQFGSGTFRGSAAVIANLLLVLQFPILHSYLLTARGRELLANIVTPLGVQKKIGANLATTTFAAISSFQLLVVFALWSPTGVVLWQATGGLWYLCVMLFIASWLFLIRSMWDAGIELQTGFMGWSSVLRGQQPCYRSFPVTGVFRFCRQPIYLAFALIIWSSPVLTLDKLLLAIPWTIYLVFAPRFKEARFLKWYGDAYRAYQAEVPYLLPSLSLLLSHLFEGPIV